MPTVPDPPTSVTATGGNTTASIAFTPPANNGGAAISSYTATATPGGATQTGSASPLSVTGLTNGISYTFTVHATNSVGNSAESATSNAVTPATVPNAPTAVTATPGNQRASVAFTAPASNGGAAITGYTVTATDTTTSGNGGQTATGSGSPILITGLTNGDHYTFTVHATNSVGNSAESTASSSVIPLQTVPDAPTNVQGISGAQSAIVSFTPPVNTGGQAITQYTVTATDTIVPANGGQVATGTASPITVPGLTPGDAYTFTVTATNSIGTSVASMSTGLVIPQSPHQTSMSPPPFTNATAYTITKPVNVLQLQDEMSAAAGQTVKLSLISMGSTPSLTDNSINPSNPGTLWVSPSTILASVVNATVAAHVPNPNYGQPASVQAYLTILQLVQANNAVTLTSDQIQTVLKGLMLRMNQVQGGVLTPSGA